LGIGTQILDLWSEADILKHSANHDPFRPPWYIWNIVESGFKHHKPKPLLYKQEQLHTNYLPCNIITLHSSSNGCAMYIDLDFI